jgi:hemolysin activation/secretion protein
MHFQLLNVLKQNTILFFLICAVCISILASSVHAESISPSIVLPESIRPIPPSDETNIRNTLPDSSTAAEDTNKLEVTLSKVQASVIHPDLAVATQQLIKNIEHQKIFLSQIYAEANKLEQAYAQAGYLLVRVVIPPQSLHPDGELIIHVVDGFIEQIDVSALPQGTQSAVLKRVGHLQNQKLLKLASLERALLVAGEIPGVKLKSILARGSQEGGTKLILNCDCQMASISLGIDNRLDPSLDNWQAATVFSFNNLRGEQLYGIVGTGGDIGNAFSNNATIALYGLGVVLPVGYQGLILNPEYTQSTVRPIAVPNILQTEGTFERYALRASYPVIKSRTTQINARLGLEHIHQELNATDFDTHLNKDVYNVTRLGADYMHRLAQGSALQTSLTLSQGLGGRNKHDAQSSNIPLSRQESDPDFTKLNLFLRSTLPLKTGAQIDIVANAQSAFNRAMLRAEQFTLDGKDALSPFRSGTLMVDEGASLRAEAAHHFGFAVKNSTLILTPYVFSAWASGNINAPTLVESEKIHGRAWGVGLRSNLLSSNRLPVSVGVELGEGFSNINSLEHVWRGSFNLLLSY